MTSIQDFFLLLLKVCFKSILDLDFFLHLLFIQTSKTPFFKKVNNIKITYITPNVSMELEGLKVKTLIWVP